MSKKANYSIKCPRCSKVFDIIHWESVNSSLNPELKEMLIDGFLWKHVCPKCNMEIETNSSLLYHNQENKYMIQYEPIIRSKEQIRIRAKELSNEWNKMFDHNNNGYMKELSRYLNYRYRFVCLKNELIEKIKIFDAGYDDITIELLKDGYRNYLIEKEGKSGIHLYFDCMKENKEVAVFIIRSSNYEQIREFPAGPMYKLMENIAKDQEIFKEDICIKYVDEDYAENIINNYSKKNK
jgi:hypothetical protein